MIKPAGLFLIAEFLLLCVALPSVVIAYRLGGYMFFFLWAATLYCFLIDRKFLHKKGEDIWRFTQVNGKNLKPILLRFFFATILLIGFTWWYDSDKLFVLVHERPDIIPRILIFYTLISALPQEYIFCHFFFRRYKSFFGNGRLMIVMSAIVFAYAHVLFINPIAPVFSFLAGLLFAYTYQKTKSLALVTLEHGLYGNAIFIVGLGYYFYSGAL